MSLAGYYIIRDVELLPTGSPANTFDYLYQTDFTANASTDLLTTSIAHDQIAKEVVLLTTTGVLPAPLVPLHMYRVADATVTATTLQLAENVGPPYLPVIDITDIGSGVHSLWIRPFEQDSVISSVNAGTDIVTVTPRHFLKAGNRVRFTNSGGALPAPLVAGTDYFVDTVSLTRTTFKLIGIDFTTAGSGINTIFKPDGTGGPSPGFGRLGVFGLETVFFFTGQVQIIGGGGAGRGEGGPAEPTERVKTIIRTPEDLQRLAARAKRAADTVDNIQIVGPGFSKSPHGPGWMFNPPDTNV